MKLLVLCLLFGAAAALATTDEPENELNNEASQESGLKNGEVLNVEDPDMQDIADLESVDETDLSEAEHGDSAERAKRSCTCRPRTWCRYGRRSYIYIPTGRHWALAQKHCAALGGTLAVAHNSGTNNFLNALASGRPVWIGLSDAQYNHYWLWINGERYVYGNWCRGQPNNYRGVESCVYTVSSSAKCWNDYNCKASLGYICEKK